MKLVIDINKWLRGEGGDLSYLKRECDGKLCCFGFIALAAGFTEDEILNHRTIHTLFFTYRSKEKELSALKFLNAEKYRVAMPSEACLYIIKINDDPEINDMDRKFILKRKFKEIGVELEFV